MMIKFQHKQPCAQKRDPEVLMGLFTVYIK